MDNKFKIFDDIVEEMKMVYLHDRRPWMIGFSGGKDSTMLVMLVFEMLAKLRSDQITKKIYITSSDTMVENPVVERYMLKMSTQIGEVGEKYKIQTDIVRPEADKTFWSYLIGLGYPTPEPPGFRWCTDRLKIKPINKFTLDTIKKNGEVVMLLGVRKAESTYRARGISAREVEGKILVRHTDIENAYVYNPLTEIPNQLVWEYLLKNNGMTPWGSDNKYLFSLYQGEELGEEQSVLGEIDKDKIAVTGNSRFGCWICTMVKEDKSLLNFIDKGCEELIPYRDFRNWLVENRNNPELRDKKRRNGSVYEKADGEYGLGPYSMYGRKKILEKLLELEKETGHELITQEELKAIDLMWENEGDIYRRTLVETYARIKGEKLPWDDYRVPMFSDDAQNILEQTCQEYGVELEMMKKLIIAVENNKHYTKGNKVEKAFEKIINEGWLHHENIKAQKEEIKNENQ